jgi:RNA polymerase sigma-70 factor (ECF subfamily)
MSAVSPLHLVRTAGRDSAQDDASLVADLRADRPGALLRIWDRHAPVVRGVLRRALDPRGDVEDQVQEVFLAFHRSAHELRDPALLRAYLVGIATRKAISELRRRKVRSFLRLTDDGLLPDTEDPAVPEDDGPEALRRLYRILDGCSAADRLAFVLRHIEGLQLDEVARALDVSSATVKRQLARVQVRLVTLARRDPVLARYVIKEELAP